MSTYPKTVYQVGARHITMICERVLLRETANYFFFADRYTPGKEDKVFKDRVTVCATFEEAKAKLIDKKRAQMDRAASELETAKEELAVAEGLTGPTHKDNPNPTPQDMGPLEV